MNHIYEFSHSCVIQFYYRDSFEVVKGANTFLTNQVHAENLTEINHDLIIFHVLFRAWHGLHAFFSLSFDWLIASIVYV